MKTRIDDIEVLRAFAVLLVIVEHMQFNLFFWGMPALRRFYEYFGGWTGVDLFFVISGFVIARDLVPRLQASDNRAAFFRQSITFWIRRCWRLLPSAWLWLLVIALGSIYFNRSGVWGGVGDNLEMIVAAFLQVANFHVAMIFGQEFAGAAFVYWSLSLEEQFYLLLPFLVLLSGRRLPYVLALIVVPQIFLQRDTALLTMVRTDALFLGVLLALWSRQASYRLFQPHFMRHPLAALAVTLLLVGALACVGSEDLFITDFRFGLVTCIGGLLVWVASYDGDYLARPVWLRRLLLWVGTRSYALYLIHMPSYFLTREIWFRLEPPGTRFNSEYTYLFLFTALALMAILAEVNYRYIELPLRRRGAEIARRREQAVSRG
jgi:peptidoglycan/LPS O-acetylase OafA/YrhL